MTRLIIGLLILSSFSSQAQISKYKAKKYMLVQKDTVGDFILASRWDSCNSLIVLNVGENKMQMYSPDLEQYDVIKYTTTYTDKDGNEWFKMTAIDKDGKKCKLRIVYYTTHKEDEFAARIYIDYLDYTFSYMLDKD